MELYRRKGSLIWYCDLRVDGRRQRVSLGTSNKSEATLLARQKETELLARAAGEAVPVSLGDAVEQYVSSLESQGKVFAKELRHTQRKLLGGIPGRHSLDPRTPLHDVNPAMLERLVMARRAEGNKPQTIRHELSLIRSAARYAEGVGQKPPRMVGKNPWRVPPMVRKTRYLSQPEFERLLDHLKKQVSRQRALQGTSGHPDSHADKAEDVLHLTLALVYTGCRWSEVAHLRWDQIHLDKGVIRIWGNKTQKERLVPISQALEGVLTGRQIEGYRPTGLVFPGPQGVRRHPPEGIALAMDAVGLNTPEMVLRHGTATVHSLRHTFASWLIQNGAGLSEVSAVLGHSSITMTTRYAHLSQGAVVNRLAGILNGMKES